MCKLLVYIIIQTNSTKIIQLLLFSNLMQHGVARVRQSCVKVKRCSKDRNDKQLTGSSISETKIKVKTLIYSQNKYNPPINNI